MTFGTNDIGGAGAGYMFDSVFGQCGIQEDSTYYAPMSGIDKRLEMKQTFADNLTKAPSIGHSTGGSVTVFGLMPSFFDPAVVDRTMRQTPLLRLLPRKAVRGRAYVYNAVTAKGSYTIATAGSGFKGDDAALSDDVDTRTATSTVMKFAYVVGRVTGPALASGEGFLNLLQEDVRVKTAAMNEILENEIVNGNTSTNALGFQGLRASISTNSTSLSGAAITLDNMRSEMNTQFEANGQTDLIVTDGATHNVVKGLLMDFQRIIERPAPELAFGIPDSYMFDGALVIRDRFMPTTAASHEMLFLDLRYAFLAVLQDVTFHELAQTNDSQKYYLKWYGSLIVSYEGAMAKITSIA